MGFFRGKDGRQEVTWWRSLRSALLPKLSCEKDQTDTEVWMNAMDVKGEKKPHSLKVKGRYVAFISIVWRNNPWAQTPLTWGFLEDCFIWVPFNIVPQIILWFSPQNAVPPKQMMKEVDQSRRTQWVLCFQTYTSPPWALGQTASSSFWLSFHYFIITFPSILPYSQPGKVSFLWVFSPMFPYLLIQSYCSLFSFFISSEVSRTVLLDTVRLPCAMIFVPTLMKGNSGSLIAEYTIKQKSPLKLI